MTYSSRRLMAKNAIATTDNVATIPTDGRPPEPLLEPFPLELLLDEGGQPVWSTTVPVGEFGHWAKLSAIPSLSESN